MATRTSCTHLCLLLTIVAVAGNLDGLARGRPAHGQEVAKESPRTIDEIRSLVADLAAHAGRERTQLQMTEASLRRARALLGELEASRGNPQGNYPRSSVLSLEERRGLRDQTIAEEMGWKWSDERATLKASVRAIPDAYKVRFDQTKGKPYALTIAITSPGQKAYSWEGHEYSVFIVARDILYYVDFGPGSNGCAVIAYDLKAGKPLWKTGVWGIGEVGHSQYWNRINLEINAHHLTVFGNEGYGRYIELLDLSTGKTVGNRLLPTRRPQ
jgi:hypothetical protein